MGGKRNTRRRINRPSTWGFCDSFYTQNWASHTKTGFWTDCLIAVWNDWVWFLFPIVYVNVRKRTFTIWSIWETYTDVIWNQNISEKNTVHMWRPHHFNIKLSFLQAAWSCWFLSEWNFAVPQQPVFERRSSRVTALCIAEQSCNVSWASNWLH